VAFIRRVTCDPDTARDLAHDFFARLLSRPRLDGLRRGQGRFRSYLLGAVKHFLSDAGDRARAARRGGGVPPQSLESATASRPGLEPAASQGDMDALFDREWAASLTAKSLAALEAEFAGEKADVFHALKPWLTGDGIASQAALANRLQLAEGAVKVAIHRLRKRYRELVTAEIAQTVASPAEVGAELRHLIAALGS
jgi:RNA polymerase sigma-70 factor (ECF subfamily)